MKQDFRYQGEYESKKKQNIQEAIEFILEKNYGVTIGHIQLAKLLGYNIDDEVEIKKYRSVMARVKKFVLKYGYVLKGISGVGYYILKPTQVSSYCYRTYVKRASKLYDKSAYVLDMTDQSEMSEIRKQEIQNMINLNKQLIDKTFETIKESPYYSRKTYYDSLED